MISDEVFSKTFNKFFDADSRAKSANSLSVEQLSEFHDGPKKHAYKTVPYSGLFYGGPDATVRGLLNWLDVLKSV